MSIAIEWIVGEIISGHDLATDKCLQWQSCKHVQSKTPRIVSKSRGLNDGETYSLAMFTRTLFDGKLFKTFPCVCEPNVIKPAMPMTRHISRETAVE